MIAKYLTHCPNNQFSTSTSGNSIPDILFVFYSLKVSVPSVRFELTTARSSASLLLRSSALPGWATTAHVLIYLDKSYIIDTCDSIPAAGFISECTENHREQSSNILLHIGGALQVHWGLKTGILYRSIECLNENQPCRHKNRNNLEMYLWIVTYR